IISLVFIIIGFIGMVASAAILMIFSGTVADSIGNSKVVDIGGGYQLNLNGPALGTALIIIAVLLLIIAAFLLFTAINKFRYYSSVRTSISSVTLQSGGAKPYGVMCVISAVFTAFGVLSSIGSLIFFGNSGFSSLTGVSLVTILGNILSFVIFVLDAKIALGYKKYIDEIMYGYNEPTYGGTQPDAAPLPDYSRQDTVSTEQNPYSAPQPKTYNDGFTQTSQPVDRPAAPAVCPNCGAPTEGGAFCGNCGTKL
ncbi:MAG: zinc ribbon domain-containing protein, partial [Ruminococcus sp.]|nr:zinc ribbon domain-containing protein [Ruminococcus sp.]